MATMDVFSDDAFSMIQLTDALDKVPYKEQYLASLGIFEPRPVRTESIAVESRDGTLVIVQTSPRGAPIEQRTKDARNLRWFGTHRVAKGDTVNASEIQGIREFGTENEFEQVQNEIMRRMIAVRNDVELTHENMRLGAIQGIILDADGTELINWFDAWGITQPAEIDFDLDNANPVDGDIRKKCNAIIRNMKKASKGAWLPSTRVYALTGDTFYDQLTTHSEVRKTYLNQQEASELRNNVGQAFDMFNYGQITWVNYRGTDDNTTVAVPAGKAKFFPVGANGVFQHGMSPGESFDVVNTLGLEFYAMIVRDLERNMWVKPEVYSYPLFICSRPEMLQRAKNT